MVTVWPVGRLDPSPAEDAAGFAALPTAVAAGDSAPPQAASASTGGTMESSNRKRRRDSGACCGFKAILLVVLMRSEVLIRHGYRPFRRFVAYQRMMGSNSLRWYGSKFNAGSMSGQR